MKYLFISLLILNLYNCSETGESINSASVTPSKPSSITKAQKEKLSIATFAGGCFWCTEAIFERTKGVVDVVSGYTAGKTKNPTYRQVGMGMTGHTEAIEIYYDTTMIDYPKLVEIFFATHDPTTLNRQGPDVGTQYRSGAYYRNEVEKAIIEKHIAKLNDSGKYKNPIVTEVAPLDKFYLAEDYHQDYYEIHPENPYVQNVSKPKVIKFTKLYPELVKEKYKK